MEKKKIFIILTYTLAGIGGSQLYASGKTEYLKKNGWEVHCYSNLNVPVGTDNAVPSLKEYIQKGCGELEFLQVFPSNFRKSEQRMFINFLIQHMGIINPKECEIIIESHHITEHLWGELLAAKLGARHFCVFLHEAAAYGQNYRDFADFFYFKWQRNEILGGEAAFTRIFKGYKNISATLYKMPDTVHEQEPVQDVDFPLINRIQKRDYNICHIGRIDKLYVPYAIEGVAEFARRHPDKTICFIFVGRVDSRKDFIVKTFDTLGNVEVIAPGNMFPIPRILFSKVDVVLASAQSALFAANEGVLTVAGNGETFNKTQGVLGYDTSSPTYGDAKFSYVEVLENVLVKRLYDGKEYQLPKLRPAEEYYENFWTIVEKAAPAKEYYVERLSQEKFRYWTAIFPFGTVSRGARIIFFGNTEIAKDYRQQIQSQQNNKMEIGYGYIKQFNTPPRIMTLKL